MGSIDHDGLAELATNGSGRRFGGVGWPEDISCFSDGIDALVDDGDALLCAGLVAEFGGALGGFAASHEFYDLLPVFPSVDGTQQVAELLFGFAGEGEFELFFDEFSGNLAGAVAEFVHEHLKDRAVELFGLSDAHAEHLKADDVESGSREDVEDSAWAGAWDAEVVGFDEDERFLGGFAFWEVDGPVNDSAIGIGIFCPEEEVGLGGFRGLGGDGCGLEVGDGSGGVGDVVTEGVANGFAGGSVAEEVTDHGADFCNGVFAFDDEQEDAGASAIWGGAEVGKDVVANAFLGFAVGGVFGGDDICGVGFDEFLAGGEESGFDEI